MADEDIRGDDFHIFHTGGSFSSEFFQEDKQNNLTPYQDAVPG